MSLEPRLRPSVGIDGRQYPRKTSVYVDVLGLPTITEAVQEASRMLRRGIIRAMSSPTIDDTSPPLKLEKPIPTPPSRDLASVYSSAITKKSSAKPSPAPHSDPPPSFKSNLRSWNSAKKAGPSILSKRARPPSNSNLTERVFQPAPKRDRRPDTSDKHSIPASSDSHPQLTSDNTTKSSTLPQQQPPPPPPSKAPPIERSKHTPTSNRPPPQPPSSSSSSLPPAWSSVPGKSSSKSSTPPPPLPSPKQPPANLIKKHPSPKSSQKRSLGSATISPLQAKVKKSNIIPILPRPSPIATGAASEGIIPTPSATGIQVKYVPGSTTINGVRPNGYTVSSEGVVKPVVSFSPKPKLPHKLRQTSVEKLFEGWRDTKNFPEADALSLSLRTEQEIYADASGRTDYRAAVTVKLKELRR